MIRLGLVLLALAAAAAACDGNDGEDAAAGDHPQGAAGVVVEGEADEAPSVTVPEGDPPGDLVIHDLVEGGGDQATHGALVTTHYVGVSWTHREEFDSSWGRGEAAQFPLDGVIAGWQEGIPGMRVGGRRLLVIPPEQAYGESSPTPAIAPNDTLVFVIDLVDVGG